MVIPDEADGAEKCRLRCQDQDEVRQSLPALNVSSQGSKVSRKQKRKCFLNNVPLSQRKLKFATQVSVTLGAVPPSHQKMFAIGCSTLRPWLVCLMLETEASEFQFQMEI